MVESGAPSRLFGQRADLSSASVFGQDFEDQAAAQPDPTLEPETLWYRMDTPPGLGEDPSQVPPGSAGGTTVRGPDSPEPQQDNPFAANAGSVFDLPRQGLPGRLPVPQGNSGGQVFDNPRACPGTGFYDDSLYRSYARSSRPGQVDGQGRSTVTPQDGGGSGSADTTRILQQLVGQIDTTVQAQSQILTRLSNLENHQQSVPQPVQQQGVPQATVPAFQPAQAVPMYPQGAALAPPPPPFDPADPAGRPLDAKWIPNMPTASWQSWKTRSEEITGFWNWLESLTGWLSLIHAAFPGEIREVIGRQVPLMHTDLSREQVQRAQRLYYILQQTFGGFHRVRNLMRVYEGETGLGSSNGYEILRRLRQEFSLQTRSEALTVKSEVLNFKVKHFDNLLDLLRQVDARVFHFRQLLDTTQ